MSFKSRAIQAAIEREAAQKRAAEAAHEAETAELSLQGLEMCDRFAAQFSVPVESLAVEVIKYLTGTQAAAIRIEDEGQPLIVTEETRGQWAVLSPGRNDYDSGLYFIYRHTRPLTTLADFGEFLKAYEIK